MSGKWNENEERKGKYRRNEEERVSGLISHPDSLCLAASLLRSPTSPFPSTASVVILTIVGVVGVDVNNLPEASH